jgi:hypothetical protein
VEAIPERPSNPVMRDAHFYGDVENEYSLSQQDNYSMSPQFYGSPFEAQYSPNVYYYTNSPYSQGFLESAQGFQYNSMQQFADYSQFYPY